MLTEGEGGSIKRPNLLTHLLYVRGAKIRSTILAQSLRTLTLSGLFLVKELTFKIEYVIRFIACDKQYMYIIYINGSCQKKKHQSWD